MAFFMKRLPTMSDQRKAKAVVSATTAAAAAAVSTAFLYATQPRVAHAAALPQAAAAAGAAPSTNSSQEGRNIVIAVDYTDDSVRTVQWAMQNHVRAKDHVTLLHVPHGSHQPNLPGPFAALDEGEGDVLRRQEEKERSVSSALTAAMNSWQKSHADMQVECESVVSSEAASPPRRSLLSALLASHDPDAREAIVVEVGRRKADALIMGMHNAPAPMVASSLPPSSAASAVSPASPPLGTSPGTLARLLGPHFPRVSTYCVEHAPCPVILVPSPPPSAHHAAAAPHSNIAMMPYLDALANATPV